jgi:hypothetical protein
MKNQLTAAQHLKIAKELYIESKTREYISEYEKGILTGQAQVHLSMHNMIVCDKEYILWESFLQLCNNQEEEVSHG